MSEARCSGFCTTISYSGFRFSIQAHNVILCGCFGYYYLFIFYREIYFGSFLYGKGISYFFWYPDCDTAWFSMLVFPLKRYLLVRKLFYPIFLLSDAPSPRIFNNVDSCKNQRKLLYQLKQLF